MSKSLNTAFPARKLLRRLGLLSALLVLPTAVLAYADLLPKSLDMLGLDLRESPDLPHVARQIAIGAPLKIVAFVKTEPPGPRPGRRGGGPTCLHGAKTSLRLALWRGE